MKQLGKRIQTIKGKNITFDDCQKLCFETKECKSFGYCTFAQNCHLFDKKLDGSEELKPPNGCFTTYKICKDGKINYINDSKLQDDIFNCFFYHLFKINNFNIQILKKQLNSILIGHQI